MSATKNKWLKYKLLRNYKPLASHVPETKRMTRDALWRLVRKYTHVIIKPVWGSRGRGVIQISSLGNNHYAVHYENVRTTIHGKEQTYRYIKGIIGSTSYMVQRRISRPTIGGRPFDLRVIIQRKRNSAAWVVTGKVAKVAGRGYIVSNNGRSKGTLLPVPTALHHSTIRHHSAMNLLSKIHRVSIRSSKHLASYFPGHRIYGLDVGVDINGKVWIIEANLYPSMSHFLKLKDRTMYRRIMSYKKS
ncbi:YheC/YheD family protein [Paenibacillus filicis]|uniref:YheC/YheD family protein n=1 Tax=Paenibacillus gyeongsangnamensis TaxID=3388067 RepID=A0ABT4QGB8_9BACL|nr:YheC/YheD family protein [Paenibacillus filicis]MCZ8515781.1 YheC/YheD family protein [Paenibacillus filicis]